MRKSRVWFRTPYEEAIAKRRKREKNRKIRKRREKNMGL